MAGASSGFPAEHSAVIQSEVVRQGKRACRFELRPGDYVSQGHRAELRDPYNVVWDEEVVVRFFDAARR